VQQSYITPHCTFDSAQVDLKKELPRFPGRGRRLITADGTLRTFYRQALPKAKRSKLFQCKRVQSTLSERFQQRLLKFQFGSGAQQYQLYNKKLRRVVYLHKN